MIDSTLQTHYITTLWLVFISNPTELEMQREPLANYNKPRNVNKNRHVYQCSNYSKHKAN